MNGEKSYQSTKFVLLQNTGEIERGRTRRFLLIIFVILVVSFSIPFTYFYLKAFLEPAHDKEGSEPTSGAILSDSDSITSSTHENSSKDVVSKEIWISGKNKKRTRGHASELLCEEFPEQLQAIPFDIIPNENNKIYPSNLYSVISMDLVFYYERIIEKQSTKNLKIIFTELRKKLFSATKSEDFIDFLKSLKSNKFKFYTTYLINKNHNLEMNRFDIVYNVTDELYRWYNYLDNLGEFLSHYEVQQFKEKYHLHISETNFEKFTQKTQKRLISHSHIFDKTEEKFKEINEILNEWTKPLEIKIDGSYVSFYNKAVLTSEVNNQLISLNSSIEKLSIIATHTIYLDEELTLPGINLAIISPRWVFLKKVKINLNGLPGKNHEIDEAEKGRPGKPGNPGGNAGDFLGVGDFNEKFLQVFTNGGRGGSGQNGAMGRVGNSNTWPTFSLNKPNCTTKINSFINPLNQTITHYKVFNEIGCGGSGTDGGVGGKGGNGGRVILINKQAKPKITQGVIGVQGSPGKGGRGGFGGRNGCFYEVLDEDDEVLHLVTRVKCHDNILPSGNPGRDGQNNESQTHPPAKLNISISDCLLNFFEGSVRDFIKYNDSILISFFNELNLENQHLPTNLSFVFKLLDILERLNNMEFYISYKSKIDEYLKITDSDNLENLNHLRTIVLGKILILKPNINYMFINYKSYLDNLQRNIEYIGNDETHLTPTLSRSIESKLNRIWQNLDYLKSKFKILDVEKNKLVENFLFGSADYTKINITRSLSFALQERKILSVVLTLIDVTSRFVKLIQNSVKSDELKFKNYIRRIIVSSEAMKRSKDDFFDKVEGITPGQKEILSDLVLCTNEYEKNADIFKKVAFFVSKLSRNEKIPPGIWENLILERGQLVERVKDTFVSIMESDAFFAEGKILLEALTDEVDHFRALYYYVERQSLEKLFLESLNGLKLKNANKETQDIKSFKSHLYEVIINFQYSLAVDATQMKLLPLRKLERRLHQSSNIFNEALKEIKHLEELTNPVCRNNHEALFDKDSTIGEFYFWPNSKIRSELENLFQGKEINLKANLNNPHVLDKNFIKFKSLKVDFECGENVNSSLYEILSNFQIEMTHSGYSFYNWKGETRVIISDEATFGYSFKERDGQPELYNDLYKKLQTDGLALSPYTTWRIRLLRTTNAASYEKLIKFKNVVNLRLVGTGVFITD